MFSCLLSKELVDRSATSAEKLASKTDCVASKILYSLPMDSEIRSALYELTIKEILARLKGILTFSREHRASKDALIDHVLQSAPAEQVAFLQQAGLDRREEKIRGQRAAEETRKRRRNDQQNTRRTAQRVESSTLTPEGEMDNQTTSQFLQLPTDAQVKGCYREFYKATSNTAVATGICGVCARALDVATDKVVPYSINSLPNAHRLVPRVPHPAHTLFDGKLLEPKGVEGEGSNAVVKTCGDCFGDLKKTVDNPPQYSLANNMWIGKIPWKLQVLTVPEQLLIALLYPRVYVFKLFPKKIGGRRDASTLQRGMRGNVSTYELDMDGILSMVQGNLMPRPPAVLASVISVTFIGLGNLPKQWLRTTFRVRRQFVFEALRWLKNHNPKYYGAIEIDPVRIEQLPEDNVPKEILGVVRQSTDTGIVDQESDGYVPMDDSGE
jgi:hypothetical protein